MSECNHNSQVYLEEVIARKNERIAELEKTITSISGGEPASIIEQQAAEIESLKEQLLNRTEMVKTADSAIVERDERIKQQAAEIAALREQQQTRWLEDALNKCAIERDALREQVERMPVCVGYVGSTTAELLSDTNWGLSKEWAINVAKERASYYNTPIYTDPPEEKGE